MDHFIRQHQEKGRIVIAGKDFLPGEVVLHDPCVVFPTSDYEQVESTALAEYCFNGDGEVDFLPLGHSALLSHSHTPNLHWSFDRTTKHVTFKALNAIQAGEELTFNYRWDSYRWETTSPSNSTE